MEKSTCIHEGCGRPVRCKDRCRRHYDQWIRTTPKAEREAPSLRGRFESMVIVDRNGCWIWQGYLTNKGYGQMRGEGGTQYAYRVAYEIWKGTPPEGTDLDHLCRVRSCVNPDHLEPVEHRENLLRGQGFAGRNARKTHCSKGHAFDGSNLIRYMDPQGNRVRICRACRDAKNRARYR